MSPSRQFAHLRRRSLATLKAAADGLPVIVADDGRAWVVTVIDRPGVGVTSDRYQVALTWIQGFAAAWGQAPWQPIDTAPRDGTLVVVRTTAVQDLPAFTTVCRWHPDAGWCVDELREPTHWLALVDLGAPAMSVLS